MRFPLGELTKPEVRALAAEHGLRVATKADSQDLCFLAGTARGRFLERHGGLTRRPGRVLDPRGRALGEHEGIHAYTVGQRRGLGIASPEPLYVIATDRAANTLTVGPRSRLLTSRIAASPVTLHRPGRQIDGVRVRAHGRRHACRLPAALGPGSHERVAIELLEPAERTAPGQVACLYAGDLVAGHGTIAA
jgi:tRNA-specific 2-thiouridylase